jgi:hypothetical protein
VKAVLEESFDGTKEDTLRIVSIDGTTTYHLIQASYDYDTRQLVLQIDVAP